MSTWVILRSVPSLTWLGCVTLTFKVFFNCRRVKKSMFSRQPFTGLLHVIRSEWRRLNSLAAAVCSQSVIIVWQWTVWHKSPSVAPIAHLDIRPSKWVRDINFVVMIMFMIGIWDSPLVRWHLNSNYIWGYIELDIRIQQDHCTDEVKKFKLHVLEPTQKRLAWDPNDCWCNFRWAV